MDMHSRNQYLKALQQKYFQAQSKKEKSSIGDEYCRNTHQNRKYVISKINSPIPSLRKKRTREEIYDGYVRAALAKVWEVFDYSGGQRLVPLLNSEVDRLRKFGELLIAHDCPRVPPMNIKLSWPQFMVTPLNAHPQPL